MIWFWSIRPDKHIGTGRPQLIRCTHWRNNMKSTTRLMRRVALIAATAAILVGSPDTGPRRRRRRFAGNGPARPSARTACRNALAPGDSGGEGDPKPGGVIRANQHERSGDSLDTDARLTLARLKRNS